MKKPSPSAIRIRGIRYPKAAAIPPKVWLNNKLLSFEKSLKIKSHSIHGFGWGEDFKGGMQLALAICAEIYSEPIAEANYLKFREIFLDCIHGESFDTVLNLQDFNEAIFNQLV